MPCDSLVLLYAPCFRVQCFRKNRPSLILRSSDRVRDQFFDRGTEFTINSPIEGPSLRPILRTHYRIPTDNRGCPLWASIDICLASMSHAPRPGRLTSCSSQNKVYKLPAAHGCWRHRYSKLCNVANGASMMVSPLLA